MRATKRPRLSRPSTAERIPVEAMRLFGEQGYDGTTIAQIEVAVGLSRGAGGIYRHYASKEAILRAGLERYMNNTAERARLLVDQLSTIDRRNLRDQLRVIARFTLADTQAERSLMRVLFSEAERLPELTSKRLHFTRLFYDGFAAWLKGLAEERIIDDIDFPAVAAVCFGALLNYWLYDVRLNEKPAGIPERRFIDTWVDATASAIETRSRKTTR